MMISMSVWVNLVYRQKIIDQVYFVFLFSVRLFLLSIMNTFKMTYGPDNIQEVYLIGKIRVFKVSNP